MEVTMNREVLKFPTGASKETRGFLEAFFPAPGKTDEDLKAYEFWIGERER